MTESQNRINELNECIKTHIEDHSIWLNSCELRLFSDGCGIFAIRDIEPNELLFGDKPLLLGPTGGNDEPIVCAMCYEVEKDVDSYLCPGQCGLVLCGENVCAKQHQNECELLQKWKPKNPSKFSFKTAKAMLIIRALFLKGEKKKFFDLMQRNYTLNDTYIEQIYFDNEFENFPQDKQTILDLREASAAMKTNAFKVLHRSRSDGDISVRSFYPIMSLLNHNCSPNARHDVDKKLVSRVFATRKIKKDEQIFITYSQLLWGTNTRRMHMMVSKQFECACNRCADPTENLTNLMAIRCQDKTCSGFLLTFEPMNIQSNAKCNLCGTICEIKRYLQFVDMFGSMTKYFCKKKFTMPEIKQFIETRLHKVLPYCSQFVIQVKLEAIWKCEPTNYDDQMILKQFCEDILKLIHKLGVGECSLKGFMTHKLYTIRKELKVSPEFSQTLNGDKEQVLQSEIDRFMNDDEALWKSTKAILKNVSAAPADVLADDD